MDKTQEKKMIELAGELAKEIRTPEDLSALSAQMKKIAAAAALGAADGTSSRL